MQQKLSELEEKQQPASVTASVSESQVPVSPVQNVFGMPTLPALNQQVDIPSTVQNRNIVWTPVTSAGISSPLPLDSCCSDNIFVEFGGHLFRQFIGIPVGTNCAPLLADFFLYCYESDFSDNMIRSGHRKLA